MNLCEIYKMYTLPFVLKRRYNKGSRKTTVKTFKKRIRKRVKSMKIKKTLLSAFLITGVLFLCSCKETASEDILPEDAAETTDLNIPEQAGETPAETEKIQEEAEKEEEEMLYQPSEEELTLFQQTWDCIVRDGEKETVYRLILGDENMAQYVVQNGIGELLGLYFGSWDIVGENQIFLDFQSEDSAAENLETCLKGIYEAEFEETYCMKLVGREQADALIPDGGGKTLTFYDTRYTPEKMQEITDAVLNYYEEQTGEEYPGKALINDITDEGVLVQLCEDMGDYTATDGWYLIDPFTFAGTDEILGGEIDFAPYSY